jgi:hypothetical protein
MSKRMVPIRIWKAHSIYEQILVWLGLAWFGLVLEFPSFEQAGQRHQQGEYQLTESQAWNSAAEHEFFIPASDSVSDHILKGGADMYKKLLVT